MVKARKSATRRSAKKAKRRTKAKAKPKAGVKARAKTRAKARKASKPKARRRPRKPQPKGVVESVAGAVRAVAEGIHETAELRRKLAGHNTAEDV